MGENQDARQKEKAKEIKVRIKFFNTKKSLFVVVVVVFLRYICNLFKNKYVLRNILKKFTRHNM